MTSPDTRSETLANYVRNSQDLHRGVTSAEDHAKRLLRPVVQQESRLMALLPEADREQRLTGAIEQLLRRFPPGRPCPPLFGLPFAVKDIIHVEGLLTRAGTRLPPELFRARQASCVSRLEQQGALVLGKSVTAEFAFIAPGPTSNPAAPGCTPGGSSSGSAAAVAAGYCPAALGTQTVGSINRPAAYCGVVGFKPSQELVPRDGVIPLSPSCDHLGLIAADMALLGMFAAALAGWPAPCQPLPARLPVLAIPDETYLSHAEDTGRRHFEATVAELEAIGCSIVRSNTLRDFKYLFRAHHDLVAHEAAQVHATWYSQHRDLYRAETADLVRRGQGVPGKTACAARRVQIAQRARLADELATLDADLWLSPAATGPAPAGLHSTGNSVMQLPWTQAGLPLLNLPWGKIDTRPAGIQLAAPFGRDHDLLQWCRLLEICRDCTQHITRGPGTGNSAA